ncbi:MAG: AzlC family ABC transporter permease [Spirochaetaceae bacterium]|jgi:4-azaleucine resistance transporter AzlC|nr:AzlC family ABC transporter permease [Spirochaetaceae bacterium]
METTSANPAPPIPPFCHTLAAAFRYSIPVLLGYVTLGTAFGLVAADGGYPWYLALTASLVMYAGAGQFIAVGLFAAGTPLAQAVLLEFVVNARHMAYGISMLRRYRNAGIFKPYLIFALTDETFALLSSLPPPENGGAVMTVDGIKQDRIRFMFLVSLLNHIYWNAGTLMGALAGTVIPWKLEGIGFALTALFIVLMIEQIIRVKKPGPFIVSAVIALGAVFLLPGNLSSRFSLLAAILISLGVVQLLGGRNAPGGTAGGRTMNGTTGDAVNSITSAGTGPEEKSRPRRREGPC